MESYRETPTRILALYKTAGPSQPQQLQQVSLSSCSSGKSSASMPFDAFRTRRLLSALTLAILLGLVQRAPGAPLGDASSDIPAGEPSGEEGEVEGPSPNTLKTLLESLLRTTRRHQKEFEDEFHNQLKYDVLSLYTVSGLPANCPLFNFSKDACLRRMLQFLEIYLSVLKVVEKECPGSIIPLESKYYSNLLVRELHKQVGDSVPTAGQGQQLLREIEALDSFQRKMIAHSILYKAHYFLVDSKFVINKRGRSRKGSSRDAFPFYTQKLKR